MGKKVADILSGLSLTIEHKCAHCGKVFEVRRGNEWGYRGYGRRGGAKDGVYYCSWSCLRAAEQGKPKTRLRGTGYKGEMERKENTW